ncbi:Inorganic pyrophosphatase [Coemansia sp. RSA 989]|nr:inorganic pyrophosphatase [Coemansia mojavensis]KAJ1743226.1 Inorganic pyrophosphatase [Coemansia sp. RSA 1086]KAJ1750901.1 Inorganic pyrophosphatase [Coemansia sp. RSA 1821]KAJ1865470.1 Inorganic pyrophosphatase [Coemansia sp. RSA 989]KAJ1872883.1 Inorganic pyrophosphatase [Coemansia sp. RSA 990]KAJ2633478.1 Inorganic pyrophosphatase [Coemansia sp. RSA 1290]KAJ2646534.1 Inorganic pyrophosphatase [Coemansia sp. RSA 1250]KAJ2676532.1 Inorganic pyrophosphatase [Coemansia sp. RSA 1085]
MYTTRVVGQPNTLEYRVFIEKDGKVVSPFHDIPLFADEANGIYNMVVEIPRWTNAKMEISKEDPLNPIKQDTKKGKLRYVRNAFPHHGYIWNYGALPQTWEDPNQVNGDTKCVGDNDPIDVCEIGEAIGYTGQVKQVKILGVMALIDEGETDWKVLVIDINDPLASKMNDVDDIERYMPGLLHATNEWFRIYKIPDGKPENQFAFGGEAKKKAYAIDVVKETAEAWGDLAAGKSNAGKIALANTQRSDANTVSEAEADKITAGGVSQNPPTIDQSLHKWFFISGSKI